MFRLALVLHLFIGSSVAGAAVIAVLSVGMATLWTILGAAAVGFVLSLPLTWYVARSLYNDV